jgi:hypothetical protein
MEDFEQLFFGIYYKLIIKTNYVSLGLIHN